MHLELRAATAEDTRSIGEAMAPLLAAGDAIALTGELGAGKTTFAQGLVRGLGFEGHVVSPTFTLVREYRSGRLPVVHADVYRLERVQDVIDLELDQSAEDGVLLVEWGDAVEALLPSGHLVAELTTDDLARRAGDRPADRRPDVAAALGTARTPAGAVEDRAGGGGSLVIVLGIDTSTEQTSVALGTEREILGTARFAGVRRHDDVVPAIERLLEWTGVELPHVGGVAVGLGPGLYTGLRVGVEAAKALAQVLGVPIVGIGSLDVLAFGVQHTSRRIVAVIDARRREVFYGLYRPVPGGVMRDGDYRVASPGALAGELEIERDEMLLVGNGAILYRKEFEQVDARVELAPASFAHPWASALVSLAAPRFIREQTDRPADLVPMYLRKTDAEITWDQRARGASA